MVHTLKFIRRHEWQPLLCFGREGMLSVVHLQCPALPDSARWQRLFVGFWLDGPLSKLHVGDTSESRGRKLLPRGAADRDEHVIHYPELWSSTASTPCVINCPFIRCDSLYIVASK